MGCKYIIKWVGKRTYKIYFDTKLTYNEIIEKCNDMGYEFINVQYFRDMPVALVKRGKNWYD